MGSGRRLQVWGVVGDSRSGEGQETPGVGSSRRLQEWGVAGDSNNLLLSIFQLYEVVGRAKQLQDAQ